jgi:hypothetical protein
MALVYIYIYIYFYSKFEFTQTVLLVKTDQFSLKSESFVRTHRARRVPSLSGQVIPLAIHKGHDSFSLMFPFS